MVIGFFLGTLPLMAICHLFSISNIFFFNAQLRYPECKDSETWHLFESIKLELCLGCFRVCKKVMTIASVMMIPLEDTGRDGKDEQQQELGEGAWGDCARMRTCSSKLALRCTHSSICHCLWHCAT